MALGRVVVNCPPVGPPTQMELENESLGDLNQRVVDSLGEPPTMEGKRMKASTLTQVVKVCLGGEAQAGIAAGSHQQPTQQWH